MNIGCLRRRRGELLFEGFFFLDEEDHFFFIGETSTQHARILPVRCCKSRVGRLELGEQAGLGNQSSWCAWNIFRQPAVLLRFEMMGGWEHDESTSWRVFPLTSIGGEFRSAVQINFRRPTGSANDGRVSMRGSHSRRADNSAADRILRHPIRIGSGIPKLGLEYTRYLWWGIIFH